MNRRTFLQRAATISGLTGSGMLLRAPLAKAEVANGQPDWWWCSDCQGLWFAGNRSAGVCVGRSKHRRPNQVYSYTLLSSATRIGQPDWWWCSKCQGLWFAGNRTNGVCPAGGGHTRLSQGNSYSLLSSAARIGQPDWWWCSKCQGLWFAGNRTEARCPAGGEHTRLSQGNSYALTFSPMRPECIYPESVDEYQLGPVGGSGGVPFTDGISGEGLSIAIPFSARVKRVLIQSGAYVDAVQLVFHQNGTEHFANHHGGDGGARSVFELDNDEYITNVSGRSGAYVDAISFTTNKRRSPEYGGKTGSPFSFDIPKGHHLIGFTGSAGAYLDSVGIRYRPGC
jgi:hypothetical protein